MTTGASILICLVICLLVAALGTTLLFIVVGNIEPEKHDIKTWRKKRQSDN